MKSIGRTHWGADRQTLLQFYTSSIRSRIDYALHIYASASVSNLKVLEGLQNQCLRIVLGARNTTPIISMNVEANIPFNIRWAFLTLKYYSKLFDYPHSSPVVRALLTYNYKFIINKIYFKELR